jgi:hypothetical protein
MDDTELRKRIAMYDSGCGDCPCGCEDAEDLDVKRVDLKTQQLAMWVKAYGTAE